MWRQRYVTVLCLVATLLLVTSVGPGHEAYNGRVQVRFLTPAVVPGNALATTTSSMVAMAGVVARSANGPRDAPVTVSSDLSLPSLGVERGWQIRQPSVGGQWEPGFEDPVLNVQSSGTTLEEAKASMAEALKAVDGALTELQDAEKVPLDLRVRTQLIPDEAAYTVQGGSHIRAVAVITLLGVLATGAAAMYLDQWRDGRRRHAKMATRTVNA
jgi:predicted RNase H-like HicB family nuclease